MSEFEEAKKFAQQFRSFVKLADELDKVGSIEQLTAQANSRLNLARTNLADVERQIEAAQARKADAAAKAAADEGEHQRKIVHAQGVLNDINSQIKVARAEMAKLENAKQALRRAVA